VQFRSYWLQTDGRIGMKKLIENFVNLPRKGNNIPRSKDIQTQNIYLEIYRRFEKNINF